MSIHSLEPHRRTLHGHFSRDLAPVLTIDSGDTVRYRTLEATWGVFDNPHPFELPPKLLTRDPETDAGHAICGPIEIRGAEPGMCLEVKIKVIRPGKWGWTCAAGADTPTNQRLGLADQPRHHVGWSLNPNTGIAINQFGQTIPMSPFMGVMGMPPDEPGQHPTPPPRYCGGNIDCKDLVVGSSLYLPISVEGGLFSVGDGHAAQGNGEVAGPGVECPMERVELTFFVHPHLHLTTPRARTPAGWITFGFHEDINEAWVLALEDMVSLMRGLYGFELRHAFAMASLIVDLHITQVVNGIKGVHAVLPTHKVRMAAPHPCRE